MSRSSTDGLVRAAVAGLLVAAASAMGGCAILGPSPAPVATGPDPALVAGFEQALTEIDGGDEAGAELRLEDLAAGHPDYAGPLVNLALISARRDELAPALVLLARALQVCTQCAPAWNELGVLQRRAGAFAEAEHAYRQALLADDGFASAHFNLGVLYELYLQRPELALEHYARFRELAGDDPAVAEVDKWMADLRRRVGAVERSAQLEGAG